MAIKEKKINPAKEISKEELFKAGLIRKKNLAVKLLASGKLENSITIRVNKASKKAQESISKSKGKLIFEVAKEKIVKENKKPNKKEK